MAEIRKEDLAVRIRELTEEFRTLAARLADVGPLYGGSVTRQMLRCGKAACACHRDPARRHGPYAYWTTKVKGKTVSRKLTPQEADLMEEWIENRRQFEATKKRLVQLSREMMPLVLELRGGQKAS